MSRRTRIALGLVIVLGVLIAVPVVVFVTVIAPASEASVAISQAVSTLAPVPADPEATAESGAVLFEIVPAESEARFIIDEVLNGNPYTVVGRTNFIGGQLLVDFAAPSQSRIGEIVVNVREFDTGDPNRNVALKGFILDGRTYEYIRFMPTMLDGLPQTPAVFGTPLAFSIAGDLTVKDRVTPVTFTAQVTPISETEIEGLASLAVNYADLGVSIPFLPPQVATVSDEMRLEIAFVAREVAQAGA